MELFIHSDNHLVLFQIFSYRINLINVLKGTSRDIYKKFPIYAFILGAFLIIRGLWFCYKAYAKSVYAFIEYDHQIQRIGDVIASDYEVMD